MSKSVSPYLTNLAEICATILTDDRWSNLFSWEANDDLSLVSCLAKYYDYIPAVDCPKSNNNNNTDDDYDNDEIRRLHLLCRIFYRAGDWFTLHDLYTRYYTTQHPPHHSIVLLLQDVHRLQQAGFVRTFSSDLECAVNLSYLVTKQDETLMFGRSLMPKRNLKRSNNQFSTTKINNSLFLVHAHYSESDENELLKLCLTQNSCRLFFTTSLNESSSSSNNDNNDEKVKLPVRKMLNRILKTKLINAVSKNNKSNIEQELTNFLKYCGGLCIRIREEPLIVLQRVCRLYLCAVNGPGRMRGDSWITVQSHDIKRETTPKRGHRITRQNQWKHVTYPALQQVFGLRTYPFHNLYRKTNISIVHDKCSNNSNNNDDSSSGCEGSYSSTKAKAYRVFKIFDGDKDLFHVWEIAAEVRSYLGYLNEALEIFHILRKIDNNSPFNEEEIEIEDSYNLLNQKGRYRFVQSLVSNYVISNMASVQDKVELTLKTLECVKSFDKTCTDNFRNDAERLICIVSVCLVEVLKLLLLKHDQNLFYKPWLRHFCIQSIIAYCLWDCIEILEKRGYYELSVSILQLILGVVVDLPASSIRPAYPDDDVLANFMLILLPRRARGKAFERLLVDLGHLEKYWRKQNISIDTKKLSRCVLSIVTKTGSIPFSFIRSISKRAKCSILDQLSACTNNELELLGIRVRCSDKQASLAKNSSTRKNRKKRKVLNEKNDYLEWAPSTDTGVANAIIRDDRKGKARFVGTNDQDYARPLSVEELALEEYQSGRFPINNDCLSGGGWVGYHDEGGHVRALFRILCWDAFLGCDIDDPSIILTPYSEAADLHSAYINTGISVAGSFYTNRKESIETFLSNLSRMKPCDICNMIYDRVKLAYETQTTMSIENIAMKDAIQVRTLSLIAVGFGGQVLANMFRALTFDYRHYSGGLADLLIIRAKYKDSSYWKDDKTDDSDHVNLGEWIGEQFASSVKGEKSFMMVMDRDDEFLGCQKMGDEQSSSKSKRGPFKMNSGKNNEKGEETSFELPPKLSLEHMNRQIQIQSMLVEVKSVNDRLDPRQEDWLNIVDRCGYARVCKFVKNNDT